ncbi:hypothetical protein [Streptomyces sedi]|uniref:hypothetical protein n=1 Tax=Streptomyces sedi TaxID=555059 RepID=UPI0014775BB1|nr:hypothetical protein [Streptomyces sedi]
MHPAARPPGAPEWLTRLAAPLAVEPAALTRALPAGGVPFRLVHDWHARAVLPLLAETEPPEPVYEPLRRLHAEAAEGRPAPEADWRAALHPALLTLHRAAFPHAEFHAKAHATALADATGHGRGPDEARRFADNTARRIADTDARCFAEAHALALTPALAAAYAASDPAAYTATFPTAHVNAYLAAHRHHAPPRHGHRPPAARLATALLELLDGAEG